MDTNGHNGNTTEMEEARRLVHYDDEKLTPSSESPTQNPYPPQPSISTLPSQEQQHSSVQPQQQHSSFQPQQQFQPQKQQQQQQQQQQQPCIYQEQGQQQQTLFNNRLHRSVTCPIPNHNTIAYGDYGESQSNNPNCNHNDSTYNCPPPTSHVLGHDENEEDFLASASCIQRTRHRIGKAIESKTAHITILVLTICDIILVMLQIGASLLHLDETEHEHWVLALFGHLSLAIVSVFMLEILLKIFAFGPRYFWIGTQHWVLHLVDAIIILTSFLLEIFLTGAEQELSGLLIVFRLWRVIKLTGTVAIEVSEHDQAHIALLKGRIKELEQELEQSYLKIQRLEGFNVPKESRRITHIE